MAYVRAAVSDSTRRAYRADLDHFLGWGGAIPATDKFVAQYLVAHAEALSVATLTRRLAAISKAHTTQGLRSPTSSDLVGLSMRGIRRTHGQPQRRVAAAVKADILAMTVTLGQSLKDHRDRALLLIGFAGALRRSELCAINCADIERVPQGIVITLNRSKTDQAGEGRKIGIPYARGIVCPVLALDGWLSASGITDGPIFRPVSRHGRIGFSGLCDRAVALVMKELAQAAGLDASRYAGHSLRAGLATSAAAAGVSSWKIREQTGHASDAMLQRYIRAGELFIDNAAGAVL
jgi:site-specific recombinase XerD